jgi:hypothetical protein
VDRGIVYVPNHGQFEADGQHIAIDYGNRAVAGSMHRAFDELDALPESVSPADGWARVAGYIPDRLVLHVTEVSAPAVSVAAKEVFGGKPFHTTVRDFWIYADALIPHLGA